MEQHCNCRGFVVLLLCVKCARSYKITDLRSVKYKLNHTLTILCMFFVRGLCTHEHQMGQHTFYSERILNESFLI